MAATPSAPTLPAGASRRDRISAMLEQFVPDPVEALIEAIYSVLIVMTFTLGVSALTVAYGPPDPAQSPWVTYLFWESFGSAVAWGLIDGFMHLTGSYFARGDQVWRFRTLRAARSEGEGMELVAYEMEEMIEMIPDTVQREQVVRSVYKAMLGARPQAVQAGLRRADITGAIGTFLVAVVAAFPVALPLLLLQYDTPISAAWIIRLSNGVACAMLFWMGFLWARKVGGSPWRTGLVLSLAGLILMVLTVPLGA